MVGARAYDWMYRHWAPWDAVGVRDDLRWLLDSGRVPPDGRAIDLGCGTGANVVHLAEQGFDATGVDFSPVALDKARERARAAGVAERCHFLQADLTDVDADLGGPYDLVVDFGVLDDLRPAGRRAMAGLIERLCGPGALFLFWCFYGPAAELPLISFHGPSRLSPTVEPGEETQLFGHAFEIEPVHVRRDDEPMACFLLTRRST